MKIIASVREMQSAMEDRRRHGKTIGVVPTMGYLHEGHLSLMKIARERSDVVVTTIFVNPTQFGPAEDFEKYPRDIKRDTQYSESAGTDILFVPTVTEMYPKRYYSYVVVEEITNVLEGKIRPAHFRGVTTIVAKLFHIIKPHIAIFGQKDAQQVTVIKRMALDLNFDVDIVVGPTVREPDGLAMSSRNVYLSSVERNESTVLYRSLNLAKELVNKGEKQSGVIIDAMMKMIASQPSARVDYISVADAETLGELPLLKKGEPVLISLAVRFGTTRLIDNTLVTV